MSPARMPEMSSEPTPLLLDNEKLRVMVYGDFGRGKTTFAGTFPEPFFIDTNGGLISLAINGVTGDTFEPTGHEDLEALFYWIRDHSDGYETIVLDTLDSLCYTLMGEITEDAVGYKEGNDKKVSLRMRFVPEQGDYFANQRQMDKFLKSLRLLDKHIVITSSMREKKGRTSPNVSQGMEKVVCDWASIIGEMVIVEPLEPGDEPYEPDALGDVPEGNERCLLTDEVNSRATKSRFRSLKPYLLEPTFERVRDLIEAEFAATQPKPAARRGKKQ